MKIKMPPAVCSEFLFYLNVNYASNKADTRKICTHAYTHTHKVNVQNMMLQYNLKSQGRADSLITSQASTTPDYLKILAA